MYKGPGTTSHVLMCNIMRTLYVLFYKTKNVVELGIDTHNPLPTYQLMRINSQNTQLEFVALFYY